MRALGALKTREASPHNWGGRGLPSAMLCFPELLSCPCALSLPRVYSQAQQGHILQSRQGEKLTSHLDQEKLQPVSSGVRGPERQRIQPLCMRARPQQLPPHLSKLLQHVLRHLPGVRRKAHPLQHKRMLIPPSLMPRLLHDTWSLWPWPLPPHASWAYSHNHLPKSWLWLCPFLYSKAVSENM